MGIIIDGQNGTGKSFLCTELQKRLPNYDLHHITGKHANTYTFYRHLLGYKVILDRGPLGELVYSELYGRKPRISVKEVNEILQYTNCYVICQSVDTIYNNLCNKGEQESSECNKEWITTERNLFFKYIRMMKNITLVPNDFRRTNMILEVLKE